MTHSKLALVSLLVAGAAAAAPNPSLPPAPPGPPDPAARRMPPPACTADGGVLFEIAQVRTSATTELQFPAEQLEIFAGGQWQRTVRADLHDPHGVVTTGCVAASSLTKLRAELDDLTLVSVTHQIICHARSDRETVYSAGGKVLWTDETCGPQALETKSRAQLDAIVKLATEASRPPAPPCCKP